MLRPNPEDINVLFSLPPTTIMQPNRKPDWKSSLTNSYLKRDKTIKRIDQPFSIKASRETYNDLSVQLTSEKRTSLDLNDAIRPGSPTMSVDSAIDLSHDLLYNTGPYKPINGQYSHRDSRHEPDLNESIDFVKSNVALRVAKDNVTKTNVNDKTEVSVDEIKDSLCDVIGEISPNSDEEENDELSETTTNTYSSSSPDKKSYTLKSTGSFTSVRETFDSNIPSTCKESVMDHQTELLSPKTVYSSNIKSSVVSSACTKSMGTKYFTNSPSKASKTSVGNPFNNITHLRALDETYHTKSTDICTPTKSDCMDFLSPFSSNYPRPRVVNSSDIQDGMGTFKGIVSKPLYGETCAVFSPNSLSNNIIMNKCGPISASVGNQVTLNNKERLSRLTKTPPKTKQRFLKRIIDEKISLSNSSQEDRSDDAPSITDNETENKSAVKVSDTPAVSTSSAVSTVDPVLSFITTLAPSTILPIPTSSLCDSNVDYKSENRSICSSDLEESSCNSSDEMSSEIPYMVNYKSYKSVTKSSDKLSDKSSEKSSKKSSEKSPEKSSIKSPIKSLQSQKKPIKISLEKSNGELPDETDKKPVVKTDNELGCGDNNIAPESIRRSTRVSKNGTISFITPLDCISYTSSDESSTETTDDYYTKIMSSTLNSATKRKRKTKPPKIRKLPRKKLKSEDPLLYPELLQRFSDANPGIDIDGTPPDEFNQNKIYYEQLIRENRYRNHRRVTKSDSQTESNTEEVFSDSIQSDYFNTKESVKQIKEGKRNSLSDFYLNLNDEPVKKTVKNDANGFKLGVITTTNMPPTYKQGSLDGSSFCESVKQTHTLEEKKKLNYMSSVERFHKSPNDSHETDYDEMDVAESFSSVNTINDRDSFPSNPLVDQSSVIAAHSSFFDKRLCKKLHGITEDCSVELTDVLKSAKMILLDSKVKVSPNSSSNYIDDMVESDLNYCDVNNLDCSANNSSSISVSYVSIADLSVDSTKSSSDISQSDLVTDYSFIPSAKSDFFHTAFVPDEPILIDGFPSNSSSETASITVKAINSKPSIYSAESTLNIDLPASDTAEPLLNNSQPTFNTVQPSIDTADSSIEEQSRDIGEPSRDIVKPSRDTEEPSIDSAKPKNVATEPDFVEPFIDTANPSLDTNIPSIDLTKQIKYVVEPSIDIVKPSIDTVQPSHNTFKSLIISTKRSIDSAEPSVNTAEPSVDTAEPSADTAKPSINSAEPSINFAEPSINSAEPSINFSEPSINFSEPSINFAEPSIDSAEPSIDSAEPSIDSAEPSVDTAEPSVDTAEPSINSAEPSINSAEPSINSAEPSIDSAGPSIDSAEPSVDTAEPSIDAAEPPIITVESGNLTVTSTSLINDKINSPNAIAKFPQASPTALPDDSADNEVYSKYSADSDDSEDSDDSASEVDTMEVSSSGEEVSEASSSEDESGEDASVSVHSNEEDGNESTEHLSETELGVKHLPDFIKGDSASKVDNLSPNLSNGKVDISTKEESRCEANATSTSRGSTKIEENVCENEEMTNKPYIEKEALKSCLVEENELAINNLSTIEQSQHNETLFTSGNSTGYESSATDSCGCAKLDKSLKRKSRGRNIFTKTQLNFSPIKSQGFLSKPAPKKLSRVRTCTLTPELTPKTKETYSNDNTVSEIIPRPNLKEIHIQNSDLCIVSIEDILSCNDIPLLPPDDGKVGNKKERTLNETSSTSKNNSSHELNELEVIPRYESTEYIKREHEDELFNESKSVHLSFSSKDSLENTSQHETSDSDMDTLSDLSILNKSNGYIDCKGVRRSVHTRILRSKLDDPVNEVFVMSPESSKKETANEQAETMKSPAEVEFCDFTIDSPYFKDKSIDKKSLQNHDSQRDEAKSNKTRSIMKSDVSHGPSIDYSASQENSLSVSPQSLKKCSAVISIQNEKEKACNNIKLYKLRSSDVKSDSTSSINNPKPFAKNMAIRTEKMFVRDDNETIPYIFQPRKMNNANELNSAHSSSNFVHNSSTENVCIVKETNVHIHEYRPKQEYDEDIFVKYLSEPSLNTSIMDELGCSPVDYKGNDYKKIFSDKNRCKMFSRNSIDILRSSCLDILSNSKSIATEHEEDSSTVTSNKPENESNNYSEFLSPSHKVFITDESRIGSTEFESTPSKSIQVYSDYSPNRKRLLKTIVKSPNIGPCGETDDIKCAGISKSKSTTTSSNGRRERLQECLILRSKEIMMNGFKK